MSFTARQIGDSLQVSAAVARTADSAQLSVTSAGASAMVADLLMDLDNDLEDADLMEHLVEDSDTRTQRKINLKILASSLLIPPLKSSLVEWDCDENVGLLVNAAILCSKAVYGGENGQVEVPAMLGHNVTQRSLIRSSSAGALKASALFEVERVGTEPRKTMLVAAVRGSASIADWLVNFDNWLRPCPDILNVTLGQNQLLAHRGFAECARVLIPRFFQQLASLLSNHHAGDIEVIITGHSAGGAVAMLLYAHFLTNKFQYPMFNKPMFRFSCITFGAPPIFSADVTSALEGLQSRSSRPGLMLAFVAEGDPVPRMDAAYAKLVPYLYHKASADEYGPPTGDKVELPPLSLFRLGEIVMLADATISKDGLDLRAYSLREEDLSQLLWANLFAHRKSLYAEWIAEVAAGRLNRRGGCERVPRGRFGT